MNTVRFVKSFSKGQITIPKQIRDLFGIKEEFWLKMYVDQERIIAEPVRKKESTLVIPAKVDKKAYLKILAQTKGTWFDEKDYKKIRKEVEDRLKKNTF